MGGDYGPRVWGYAAFGTITAGLFLLLALIMYATRSVDWYARDHGQASATATPQSPESEPAQ